MNQKLQQLRELGAGDFEHIDGSLLEHLKGTHKLLKLWGASPTLQEAGLYHAAYGTAGFGQSLISLSQRKSVSDIIGIESERVVYEYCACDRSYFLPQFAKAGNPEYRNRFTGEFLYLNGDALSAFCELTVANEVEIAIDNREFVTEHGAELAKMAKGMMPYLSEAAINAAEDVFG